jgi:hypothetical protein
MLAFGQQGGPHVHRRLDSSNLGRIRLRRQRMGHIRRLPILEALEHSARRDASVPLPQTRSVEECQLLELLFL